MYKTNPLVGGRSGGPGSGGLSLLAKISKGIKQSLSGLKWWQAALMVGAGVSVIVVMGWVYGPAPRIRVKRGGGGGWRGRGRYKSRGGSRKSGGQRQMSEGERMLRLMQEWKAVDNLLEGLAVNQMVPVRAKGVEGVTEEWRDEALNELTRASEGVMKNVQRQRGQDEGVVEERIVEFLQDPQEWQVEFSMERLGARERYIVYSTCERLGLHHMKTESAILVRKLEFPVEDILAHHPHRNKPLSDRVVSLRDCLLQLEEFAMQRLLRLDAMTSADEESNKKGGAYRKKQRKMLVFAFQDVLHQIDALKEHLTNK